MKRKTFGISSKAITETVKKEMTMRRKYERVKTDYSGGFTDLLKNVDKVLEKYFDNYQVEIIVTDNGFATITVFSNKNDSTTVTVDLSYSDGKANLVTEDGKKLSVKCDVEEDDYEDLSDALIEIVEKELKKNEKEKKEQFRRSRLNSTLALERKIRRQR